MENPEKPKQKQLVWLMILGMLSVGGTLALFGAVSWFAPDPEVPSAPVSPSAVGNS